VLRKVMSDKTAGASHHNYDLLHPSLPLLPSRLVPRSGRWSRTVLARNTTLGEITARRLAHTTKTHSPRPGRGVKPAPGPAPSRRQPRPASPRPPAPPGRRDPAQTVRGHGTPRTP